MGMCYSKDTIKQNIPENLDVKTVKPFVPPIYQGRVIKCYDGDTITIAAYLPYDASPLYKFSVRLNGIDCPEMRTHNENEKAVSKIAKEKLSEKILNKMVTLENVSTEKYGRLLADVIYEGQSMGAWLLEQNLAINYDGGTKKPPDDWLVYYHEKNPANNNI
jgi:endonuclease YncB( thermonuclease family)